MVVHACNPSYSRSTGRKITSSKTLSQNQNKNKRVGCEASVLRRSTRREAQNNKLETCESIITPKYEREMERFRARKTPAQATGRGQHPGIIHEDRRLLRRGGAKGTQAHVRTSPATRPVGHQLCRVIRGGPAHPRARPPSRPPSPAGRPHTRIPPRSSRGSGVRRHLPQWKTAMTFFHRGLRRLRPSLVPARKPCPLSPRSVLVSVGQMGLGPPSMGEAEDVAFTLNLKRAELVSPSSPAA
jgi:hypothetical protein